MTAWIAREKRAESGREERLGYKQRNQKERKKSFGLRGRETRWRKPGGNRKRKKDCCGEKGDSLQKSDLKLGASKPSVKACDLGSVNLAHPSIPTVI